MKYEGGRELRIDEALRARARGPAEADLSWSPLIGDGTGGVKKGRALEGKHLNMNMKLEPLSVGRGGREFEAIQPDHALRD